MEYFDVECDNCENLITLESKDLDDAVIQSEYIKRFTYDNNKFKRALCDMLGMSYHADKHAISARLMTKID